MICAISGKLKLALLKKNYSFLKIQKMKNLILLITIICFTTINTHFTFAQNNYEATAFKSEVSGAGQAIILIPGLACSGEVWEETVKELSKNYQCHVLTLAGFAGQASIENPYLPTIKKEIIQYIKSNNLKDVILMGHSLGGFLSMWIAAEENDLIKKVLIVDSLPFLAAATMPTLTVEQVKPQAEMMKNFIIKQDVETYNKNQKQTLAAMITAPEDIEKALVWSIASDKSTVAQAMYELMTTDLRETITTLTQPTLVLGAWYAGKDYGMTKAGTQKTYEDQYKNAKNCRVHMADTAKHFIMFDETEWYMNEVVSFLNQ